jgi:hypothetical protein
MTQRVMQPDRRTYERPKKFDVTPFRPSESRYSPGDRVLRAAGQERGCGGTHDPNLSSSPKALRMSGTASARASSNEGHPSPGRAAKNGAPPRLSPSPRSTPA